MSSDDLTKAIQGLESFFGKPSQKTLGAAVFQSDTAIGIEQLDEFAKSKYKYFAGDAWESLGEENWTKTWELVYRRADGVSGDILVELRDLKDAATALAASQLTENHDDPQGAEGALKGVFDSPQIHCVSIYRIGDSEAITGVLLAGILGSERGVAVVYLMD